MIAQLIELPQRFDESQQPGMMHIRFESEVVLARKQSAVSSPLSIPTVLWLHSEEIFEKQRTVPSGGERKTKSQLQSSTNLVQI